LDQKIIILFATILATYNMPHTLLAPTRKNQLSHCTGASEKKKGSSVVGFSQFAPVRANRFLKVFGFAEPAVFTNNLA
jgi:hypothetical protein